MAVTAQACFGVVTGRTSASTNRSSRRTTEFIYGSQPTADAVVPLGEILVHHSFSLPLQSWCPDRAQWRGIDPGLVHHLQIVDFKRLTAATQPGVRTD
jgi:hypothetical protein